MRHEKPWSIARRRRRRRQGHHTPLVLPHSRRLPLNAANKNKTPTTSLGRFAPLAAEQDPSTLPTNHHLPPSNHTATCRVSLTFPPSHLRQDNQHQDHALQVRCSKDLSRRQAQVTSSPNTDIIRYCICPICPGAPLGTLTFDTRKQTFFCRNCKSHTPHPNRTLLLANCLQKTTTRLQLLLQNPPANCKDMEGVVSATALEDIRNTLTNHDERITSLNMKVDDISKKINIFHTSTEASLNEHCEQLQKITKKAAENQALNDRKLDQVIELLKRSPPPSQDSDIAMSDQTRRPSTPVPIQKAQQDSAKPWQKQLADARRHEARVSLPIPSTWEQLQESDMNTSSLRSPLTATYFICTKKGRTSVKKRLLLTTALKNNKRACRGFGIHFHHIIEIIHEEQEREFIISTLMKTGEKPLPLSYDPLSLPPTASDTSPAAQQRHRAHLLQRWQDSADCGPRITRNFYLSEISRLKKYEDNLNATAAPSPLPEEQRHQLPNSPTEACSAHPGRIRTRRLPYPPLSTSRGPAKIARMSTPVNDARNNSTNSMGIHSPIANSPLRTSSAPSAPSTHQN